MRVLIESTPAAELTFPPRCPHCDGVTTTTRQLMAPRMARAGFFTKDLHSLEVIEVPACNRMPRALVAYFVQIALVFVTVAAALAIMATPYAAIIAVAGLAANLALWRARTWIHLEPVVDDVLAFRVRDPAYAHGLARLNGGRVIGGGTPPQLPDGDERRAPLPTARMR